MSSQFEDYFYDGDLTEASEDERNLFADLKEEHSKVLTSYLHSLLIISLVIVILLVIKLLSRYIKHRKKTLSEFCIKEIERF